MFKKKILIILTGISLQCFSQIEISISYKNHEYLLNKNSIVLDSSNKPYQYADWVELYYSGDYVIIPITPGEEKIFFRTKMVSEEERNNYYAESKKPNPTLDFVNGEKMFLFSGPDINGNEIGSKTFAGKIAVINFWFLPLLVFVKKQHAAVVSCVQVAQRRQ